MSLKYRLKRVSKIAGMCLIAYYAGRGCNSLAYSQETPSAQEENEIKGGALDEQVELSWDKLRAESRQSLRSTWETQSQTQCYGD